MDAAFSDVSSNCMSSECIITSIFIVINIIMGNILLLLMMIDVIRYMFIVGLLIAETFA